MLTPTARKTYAPRGETPIQSCWARHGRISVISAVTISPRQQRPGFYFLLLPNNTGAKAADTISFLRHLRGRLQGPLTICWDRGRIHDHSREVRDWLSRQRKIVTERFPAYAPELNPDEYAWSHTTYAKLCNYAAPSLEAMRVEVARELKELQQNKPLLKSFVEHAKLTFGKMKQLYRCWNQ